LPVRCLFDDAVARDQAAAVVEFAGDDARTDGAKRLLAAESWDIAPDEIAFGLATGEEGQ
jgi:hypothetical protein